MIKLIDFSIGFHNRLLLQHIDTCFPAGCLTALVGRNGSGKSTLLKAICGLNENYEGEIMIEGKNIKQQTRHRLSHLISYVNTQRPKISNIKCREVVALGRLPYTGWHGKVSEKDSKIIEDALNVVGMSSYSDRLIKSLSDGECQKIMIARAIAQSTKIMLLDEPTSFLDLPTRYEIVKLLKDLAHRDNKCIIYSTHELDIALKLSDRIALFDTPDLINLPTQEMINRQHIPRLFNIS